MIMPKGQQLLMPVSPLFLWASLVAALALNMLPLGRVVWTPDWVMVLLVFWGVHQPHRVGMGVAFVMGLTMDVYESALLGQHALVYCLAMFVALLTSRRMLWFGALSQAFQLLPLFAAAHALVLVIGFISGGLLPDWTGVIAPLLEAALWPFISWFLLAPQRRPPDRDENRPL